jgi:hypothetical protein
VHQQNGDEEVLAYPGLRDPISTYEEWDKALAHIKAKDGKYKFQQHYKYPP